MDFVEQAWERYIASVTDQAPDCLEAALAAKAQYEMGVSEVLTAYLTGKLDRKKALRVVTRLKLEIMDGQDKRAERN